MAAEQDRVIRTLRPAERACPSCRSKVDLWEVDVVRVSGDDRTQTTYSLCCHCDKALA